jgi:hypothetical protein
LEESQKEKVTVGFDKAFFDNFSAHLDKYFKRFKSGFVTITITIACGEHYNVNRIISSDESLLTFAYYDSKKERQLEKVVKERTGESTAFPALTVPYAAIISVEINPANIKVISGKKKAKMGFIADEPRPSTFN